MLSIGHACRASGHRFRVNDITCHPVLPLLVTTSHHNIPEFSNTCSQNSDNTEHVDHKQDVNKSKDMPSAVCINVIFIF